MVPESGENMGRVPHRSWRGSSLTASKRKGYLYATALKRSENGEYCIVSLGEKEASKQANFHGIIVNVEVLESTDHVVWSRDEQGLHIKYDGEGVDPIVFKIQID